MWNLGVNELQITSVPILSAEGRSLRLHWPRTRQHRKISPAESVFLLSRNGLGKVFFNTKQSLLEYHGPNLRIVGDHVHPSMILEQHINMEEAWTLFFISISYHPMFWVHMHWRGVNAASGKSILLHILIITLLHQLVSVPVIFYWWLYCLYTVQHNMTLNRSLDCNIHQLPPKSKTC